MEQAMAYVCCSAEESRVKVQRYCRKIYELGYVPICPSIAFGYPNALWGEPQSPGSRERREVKCFLQEWLLGQWQVQPLALD